MSLNLRTRLRIAQRIRDKLHQMYQQRVSGPGSLREYVDKACAALTRNLRLQAAAEARGYDGAANRLGRRLPITISDLERELRNLTRTADRGDARIPGMRDLADELTALETEFCGVSWDENQRCLMVITESIVLEGVYFGSFEIRLCLDDLCHLDQRSFLVIALDPNSASSNAGVTHPHVSDDRMCPGDAAVPIQSALEQGRICEFFQIVDRVLKTYNPDSPYVSLDDWDGEPCRDCGAMMGQEDSRFCDLCESDYCEECISYCANCDRNGCFGCLTECAECHMCFCAGCSASCSSCCNTHCHECVEEDLCPTCHKESQHEPPETIEESSQEPQVPAISNDAQTHAA